MIAFWESNLNRRGRKAQTMTLESILSSVKISKNSFTLNDSFKTIRYISDEEYLNNVHEYVEPMFTETPYSLNGQLPRFILFYFQLLELLVKQHLLNIFVIQNMGYIGICLTVKWLNLVYKVQFRMQLVQSI